MLFDVRKSNKIPLFTFILFILLTANTLCFAIEYSPGVITGKITDKNNNKPLIGAEVSAYDSDGASKDEFIGKTQTDANGQYVIKIPKRSASSQWDGPKTSYHTQWRPDIYILVDKPQYKRNKSRVYTDHMLKNNLVINLAMEALPGGRTVRGRIYQADGRTPLAGALVTACDADTGTDQVMGSATTDAFGNYNIEYAAGSWDGPKTDHHTQWRPDVFVVVTKDGWERTKSGTFADQELAVPLSINVRVTSKPGKKHMITSNMCEPSPAARCKAKGSDYIWLGPENALGRCTKLRSEVMAIKTATQIGKPHVWAYLAFFETVGSGAYKKSLPSYVKSTLNGYFPNQLLNEVNYAASKHTWSGNAMTDCSTIYFPADSGRGIVSTIENGNIFKPGYENWLNWFLHELEHANQCINWGGRLNYADQWFSQLDTPVLAEIMENAGLPILRMKEIHDKMPMERQADSKANEIQSKLKLTPPMPSVRQPLNRVPLTIPESRLPTSRRIQ